MMSQILASTNDNLPRKDYSGKEIRSEVEMTLRACKRCGEIGCTSKECLEKCPYCVTSHPVGECPMTQVTCFLCEGINHVPVECKFYSMVQRMNQQAKDGPCQLLGKTQEEGKERLSRDCLKKRERFPTVTVEYGEMEIRELLALERPQKKKDNS
jgi:hypothetical protein